MLKQLKSRHREIARLEHAGYRPMEIAERLGLDKQTIYLIRKDPLYKQSLARLEDEADESIIDVRKELAKMSITAVQKLNELMSSYDDRVSLSATKDVLDRAGYKPVEVSKNFHAHAHFSSEDIEELKSRALEAGAMIPDAELIEEDDEIFVPDAPPTEYLTSPME